MEKIKEIFENAIEKFVDFVDEHPVLTPILVSAIANYYNYGLFKNKLVR